MNYFDIKNNKNYEKKEELINEITYLSTNNLKNNKKINKFQIRSF